MSFRKLLIPFVLVGYMIGISGCSQSKIDALSGQWRLIWINNLSDPNYYVWVFQDGILDIYIYPPSGQSYVTSTAKYETKAEFIDAVINISELQSSGNFVDATPFVSVGEWTIVEIDDEVMRLDTEDQGGHVIREFVRVK